MKTYNFLFNQLLKLFFCDAFEVINWEKKMQPFCFRILKKFLTFFIPGKKHHLALCLFEIRFTKILNNNLQ